jgi:hypothetical protein
LEKIDMSKIPTANAPDSLSVTDGTTLIGHIVARDGSYFAFRPDDSSARRIRHARRSRARISRRQQIPAAPE